MSSTTIPNKLWAITLPSPGAVPPIVQFDVLTMVIATAKYEMPKSTVAVSSVPMELPQ